MNNFKLSADFSFDSRNIKSAEGFRVYFVVIFEKLDQSQHVYLKNKIADSLGLKPYAVPTKWGDGPVRYEELCFETFPQDLPRCKSMIALLKEENVGLTANGYRYPPDSDHPLLATIAPSLEWAGRVKEAGGLHAFIGKAWRECQSDLATNAQDIKAVQPKAPKLDLSGG